MRHCWQFFIILQLFTLAHDSVAQTLTVQAQQLSGKEAKLQVTTAVYREIAGHSIQADVHRSASPSIRPAIVWLHGGALIMGGREGVPRQFLELAEEKDYAIVSLDYRLAPETKLPEIISDIEAAFRWIEETAAAKFRIDAKRIVVAGGSAGGYLTLVTGYRVSPRPAALVALFGYGELTGDWYSTPSPHPRHNPRKITREQAAAETNGMVISNSKQRKGNGSNIYLYYRQNGLWPQHVSGFDPSELKQKIVPYEPLRNVTSNYPPTLLMHGNKDTDVPYAQSTMMAKKLADHSVPVTLETIDHGEHGFTGGDPAQIEGAYRTMRTFISGYLD